MSPKVFRFIRQSQGLTQKQLSEMLGISEAMVCMIERNKKNISARVNKKFRETFGNEYVEKCRAFLEEN
ncbi:helix-turn-helix domain-containing protein [Neobacillus sp. M.A.Huq-85]